MKLFSSTRGRCLSTASKTKYFCRALSGAASEAVASFLLAALPTQNGEAGLNAAGALILCLKGVTSVAHLLAAAAPLAERLLQTPHEVSI